MNLPPPAKFTLDDAEAAHTAWRANCGPGALAAVMGVTLDQVRPHMRGFEGKGYTNPTLMFDALKSFGARWREADGPWPSLGLVRIQWEGPWTEPGVPIRVRYRHTHWVASHRAGNITHVFDINCMCCGGWVPLAEWVDEVAPWIIREVVPRGNGKWHATHRLEVERRE